MSGDGMHGCEASPIRRAYRGQKGLTHTEGGLGGSGVKDASGGCRTRVPDQRSDGQDGQAVGKDIGTFSYVFMYLLVHMYLHSRWLYAGWLAHWLTG